MKILFASLLSAALLGGASLPTLLEEGPPAGGSSLLAASGSVAESNSTTQSSSFVENSAPPPSVPTSETPPHSVSGAESMATSGAPSNSISPSSFVPESTSSSELTAESEVTVVATEDPEAEKQPATLPHDYAALLATTQADSMMGYYGMARNPACTSVAAVFPLADTTAKTEDEAYTLLWDAMNAAFEALAASGAEAAHCVFAEESISIYTV